MLIRAGMLRNYPIAVASTGYVSEIALVAMGIGGLGTVLTQYPTPFWHRCSWAARISSLVGPARAGQCQRAHPRPRLRRRPADPRFRAIGLMLAGHLA